MGVDTSLTRSKTLCLKLEKENFEEWRSSSCSQRLKWGTYWTIESLASQPKYKYFYEDVQGLAMSRSMGDNISKPYGVTHKP